MNLDGKIKELVDFAQARTQQWREELDTFSLTRLGIVGAGVMGTAIAAQAAAKRLPCILFDIDAEALKRAERQAVKLLETHHGLAPEAAAEATANLIQMTAASAPLATCEVVIESTPEVPSIKQAVFNTIEPVLNKDTILGSNTSTIPIGRLASMVKQPERLCGLHFFHPVGLRPLVEIIRSEHSSTRTLAGALAVAAAFERPAIQTGDSPGFVVNRLLQPYMTEAMELLLEGVSIEQVESAARSFGMAKGPLELLDEIGLDTTLHGGRVLWETWPDRIKVSPLLIPMYKKRLYGVKTGSGFFLYDNQDGTDESVAQTRKVNPAAIALIDYWMKPSKDSDANTVKPLTDAQIADRLIQPMADEARLLLDEGVVTDPRDIHLAALFGLGFPSQHIERLC